MTDKMAALPEQPLRIEKPAYGGHGLARTSAGEVVFVPLALPGELVTVAGNDAAPTPCIVERSAERTEPRCVHFGVCGGCQYQMARYEAQLEMKAQILRETLDRAHVGPLPLLQVWPSPDPWGYRSRIRLHVKQVEGLWRLGYKKRGTKEFLPIRMCPIATPVLWEAADALMRSAAQHRQTAEWFAAAVEVEISCDDAAQKVQVHLLCPGDVPRAKNSLATVAEHVKAAGVPLVSMGASRLHVASGRALHPLAAWGADGLSYRVGEDRFWLERGSFFQVNRLLLPIIVKLVADERRGALAWDLYAGVGLFTRALARSFARVTAVEASAIAVRELRRGLRRAEDQVFEETTLTFLRQAAVQRDRPSLVVLDPPRAGAGEETCQLLARLQPEVVVYVSCDPTTLARDAAVLLAAGYRVADLHLLDLFPQTYHLETVMVLHREDMQG